MSFQLIEPASSTGMWQLNRKNEKKIGGVFDKKNKQ
jgi:hypothetical protein